jgi:hypothetical protein
MRHLRLRHVALLGPRKAPNHLAFDAVAIPLLGAGEVSQVGFLECLVFAHARFLNRNRQQNRRWWHAREVPAHSAETEAKREE